MSDDDEPEEQQIATHTTGLQSTHESRQQNIIYSILEPIEWQLPPIAPPATLVRVCAPQTEPEPFSYLTVPLGFTFLPGTRAHCTAVHWNLA